MSTSNIFISHASTDRQLADLFKNTLVIGGISGHTIFYSSARSTGVPVGEDFRRHLRTKLRESDLVIQLISPTFLKKHMCLFEVGAAWVLDIPTYPIVVPPSTRFEVSRYLGDTHTGILDKEADIDDVFSELSDQVQQRFQTPLSVSGWNEAVRQFKSLLPVSMPPTLSTTVEQESDGDPKTVVITSADQVSGQTLQEQIAPFLERIKIRQQITEIYIRIPGQDAWLGFSTSAYRHFGMDYNAVHIYYSDPALSKRPQLDTFANWNEGLTLTRVIEIVRRILQDDPERRSMAAFNADQLIMDFRHEIHRIAG